MNFAIERRASFAINFVKMIVVGIVFGMIVAGALGCNAPPINDPCAETKIVKSTLPDGFPPLEYGACDYEHERMVALREQMRATAFKIMLCLDDAYGAELFSSELGDITPYIENIEIEPTPFVGRCDDREQSIEFYTSDKLLRYYPFQFGSEWDMYWFAGELHAIYRGYLLDAWEYDVVNNGNLPFPGAGAFAHRQCVAEYQPFGIP